MAMVKTKKPLPSSILLKDYLLDDMSSCSSNGFRSYPRKQCCATTVRFLLEIDLRNRESISQRKSLLETKQPKMSVLQRASEAVINLFRFASGSSKSKQIETKRSSILPRSLSRKLLKRSFWKKKGKGMKIERLKSFQYYLDQKEQPPPPSVLPRSSTVTSAAKIAAADSTSESNSNSNNSWSSSEFTSDYLQCSSGNSESSCGNDVAEGVQKVTAGEVGVIVGGDSTEAATNSNQKNKWPKEEKEQFSPVSVLDIPFGDDEEEEEEEEEEDVSSPFQSRLTIVEGAKHKFMQKLHRFESLAKLEPVALENRFSLSDESPNQETFQGTIKHDQIEDKALDLLHELASSIPSNSFKFLEDNLVLDFFKEKVAEAGSSSKHSCLLIEANDWIIGNPHELFLEWEVQRNRHVYLRDMEKEGRWRSVDEHRDKVAMDLEVEVFATLVNEVFDDLVSS